MTNASLDWNLQIQRRAGEILDLAPDRIFVVDRSGRILYANQPGQHTAANLYGDRKSIFDFLLPEYHEIAQGTINRVLSTHTGESFETCLTIDQKDQWFLASALPLVFDTQHDGGAKDHVLVLLIRLADPSLPENETSSKQRNRALEKHPDERNQTAQKYSRYLDAIGNLNIQLTQLNQVQVVLQTLAECIMEAMNAGFIAIFRVEKDWIEFAAGVKAPVLKHRRECLDDEGIIGQALRKNEIRFMDRLDGDTARRIWRDLPRETNIHSLLIVPVISSDANRNILYLGYDHPILFDAYDERVLRAFVEATINTLRRIRLVQQLASYIQVRDQEVSVLYELSTYSSESIDVEDLLHKSLIRIMKAAGCDSGLITWSSELNPQGEMVSCWPQTGIPEPIKRFLRQGVSLNRPERTDPQQPAALISTGADAYAFLTVPVRAKRKKEYLLYLFGDLQNLNSAEVVHLVKSAARQIGLSIDNILDRKLAEEAIVLEERQRMARNLHDSITQALYALSLSSDVALKAYQRQDDERLHIALEDITRSSLQALKEIRLMLFELRPTALEKVGLMEALELRLNTVERRSSMTTHLEWTGNAFIPESLEVELYSIVSEALNNSLRHAQARSVWVRVRVSTYMISLEVEDDGKGFEIDSLSRGGMGLVSMNERARKLGGNLNVVSSEGRGTRITFKVRMPGEI